VIQNLLHELKYRNRPELGRLLGRVYGGELSAAGFGTSFDIIIPVPLHPKKKKRRGYNQSDEFGKGLSEALNVFCSDEILQRVEMTSTQTRKSRLGRWENVKDIFQIKDTGAVAAKRVLLVDDVVTTGATLEGAGNEILKYCKELSVACIAATQ
jgi:ComF family protein